MSTEEILMIALGVAVIGFLGLAMLVVYQRGRRAGERGAVMPSQIPDIIS